MNPDLLLAAVSVLAGFLLKTSLAFGVCLILSWLVESPGRRFLIWLGLLFAMAGYWLWLAKSLLTSARVAASAAPVLSQPMSAVHAFEIPGSWAFPLGVALRMMGIVYLLISCYLLFSHVNKLRQLKWILGFTSQPPVEIEQAFQPLAKKLGVGRSRLLVLSGASSPATFGWFRPIIVLPDICLQQDRSELEDILRHELHHVRRCDFVWNGLSVLCRALLFFHPAAWCALRRMEFERELACDLAVVSDSPSERAKYAECLIHFARLNAAQNAANWGIDFAASSDHLKTRVHSILAGSRKLSLWLVCSRLTCGVALLAGFVYVEPSLGVLLTYARQQIAQPLVPEIQPTFVRESSRAGSPRRGRLATTPSAPRQGAALASMDQAAPADDFVAEPGTNNPSSAPASGGPQLLHRGAAVAGNRASQQTVVPIQDGTGQSAKGDHDSKQALQQSATAAASLLKRLSAVDRH
jgi:beta-lactamase regulating signal transducer with metallopeptidase domain